MSLLKKLFGGGADTSPPGEAYKGFEITVAPVKAAGGYRVGAVIRKDDQSHEMIRADVVASEEEARTTSLLKAKSLIDEQGTTIF
ncbi:MAG: HlyU family transcriptional regulator [Pseudomonadota bacterium]